MPYVSNTVRYFLGEELPVKQRCLQMPALTMKTKEFRINMCQIGKIILIRLPFIRMDRFVLLSDDNFNITIQMIWSGAYYANDGYDKIKAVFRNV